MPGDSLEFSRASVSVSASASAGSSRFKKFHEREKKLRTSSKGWYRTRGYGRESLSFSVLFLNLSLYYCSKFSSRHHSSTVSKCVMSSKIQMNSFGKRSNASSSPFSGPCPMTLEKSREDHRDITSFDAALKKRSWTSSKLLYIQPSNESWMRGGPSWGAILCLVLSKTW
jgi:hypothetical protein